MKNDICGVPFEQAKRWYFNECRETRHAKGTKGEALVTMITRASFYVVGKLSAIFAIVAARLAFVCISSLSSAGIPNTIL